MPEKELYKFGPFHLDVDDRQLIRDGQPIHLEPKVFEVLVVLVRNQGQLLKKEQLKKEIDVNSEAVLARHVSVLRKTLGDSLLEQRKYIRTAWKSGYRFVAPVQKITPDQESATGENQVSDVAMIQDSSVTRNNTGSLPKRSRRQTLLLVLLTVGLITAAVFWYYRQEVETIERVVRESQEYETLTAYTDPDAFDERTLNKHWLDESQDGRDIKRIKDTLGTLRKEGRRYGKESRVVSFDFLSVDWLLFSNTAHVKTQESWFLPMYYRDGKPYPRKPEQGWDGYYVLRKVNGTWLIQSAILPKARPIPSPSPVTASPSVAPAR